MSNMVTALMPALKKSLEQQTGFEIASAIMVKEKNTDEIKFTCENAKTGQKYRAVLDAENQFTSLMLQYMEGVTEPYEKMALVLIFEPERKIMLQRWIIEAGGLLLAEQTDMLTNEKTTK